MHKGIDLKAQIKRLYLEERFHVFNVTRGKKMLYAGMNRFASFFFFLSTQFEGVPVGWFQFSLFTIVSLKNHFSAF
jgi:hypothetical protein